MAVVITVADVKQLPAAASIPDAIISGYIAVVDQADACLDANSVPDDVQTALKLNAVWHLVELSLRGGVTSESSPTGASRSYTMSQGLASTPYGQILQTIDQYGCVTGLVSKTGNTMFFRAVG